MTRFANWSASRLITIWLVGLAIEAAVLTAHWFASADARTESRRIEADLDSAQNAIATATLLPKQLHDSLRAKLITTAESVGIKLETHGDTTVVRMPPEMEHSWNAFFESVARGIDRAILIGALELFLIPAVLTLLTLAWLIQRHRGAASGHAGAA